MADELRIGLFELLRKAMINQDANFLKKGVRVLSQALMEMEVQEHGGARRHERSGFGFDRFCEPITVKRGFAPPPRTVWL